MLTNLSRLGRPAALLGGLLFCLHYGLQLAHGLRTGRILWEAMDTGLGRADGVAFACAFAAVDVALLGIFAGLGGRARWLGLAGAVAALCALSAALMGLFSFTAGQLIPWAFPLSCLTMFAGAILLGAASLRARSLPRWAGTIVILFAFLTPGLGFALPLLESRLLPLYALFELHFVFAGLAWLAVGASMPRHRAALARPAFEVA